MQEIAFFAPIFGGKGGVKQRKTPEQDSVRGRRHPESNWGIKVLQTSALPLGYVAIKRAYIIHETLSFVKGIRKYFFAADGAQTPFHL